MRGLMLSVLFAVACLGSGVVLAEGESFVPPAGGFTTVATIEFRQEAVVLGREVKVSNICRWAKGDCDPLAGFSELVIVRIEKDKAFLPVDIDQVRQALDGAGLNIASIRFVGATRCVVKRSDAIVTGSDVLRHYSEAKQGISQAVTVSQPSLGREGLVSNVSNIEGALANTVVGSVDRAIAQPAAARLDAVKPRQPVTDEIAAASAQPATMSGSSIPSQMTADFGGPAGEARSLRDLIIADVAAKNAVNPDSLQVDFAAGADQYLKLSEPFYQFKVDSRRRGLGALAWDVQIVRHAQIQKVSIAATARIWEDRLIATRPMASRQIIQADDVVQKRVLTDTLSDDPILKPEQIVGQLTSRDIRPGTVITGRFVSPLPLVQSGQLVTVKINQGGVQITTVARAMEGGTYGQVIKVRNETTRSIYEVTVIGVQTGAVGSVRS